VQTDGWPPTPGAWKALGSNVTLLRGLLQAWLTIRARTTPAVGAVGQGGPSGCGTRSRPRGSGRSPRADVGCKPGLSTRDQTARCQARRGIGAPNGRHVGRVMLRSRPIAPATWGSGGGNGSIGPVFMAHISMGRARLPRAGYARWGCGGTAARRLLRQGKNMPGTPVQPSVFTARDTPIMGWKLYWLLALGTV
jgi:hypothetical protein